MLIVAPRGTTNCETERRTPSASSAVFIERGITAAELDVENASSWTLRIAFKNLTGSRRAMTATITRCPVTSASSPASTVPIYTDRPRIASKPASTQSCASRPKTAAGARSIAQLTIFIESSCTDAVNSTMMSARSRAIDMSAIPRRMASATTWSIRSSSTAATYGGRWGSVRGLWTRRNIPDRDVKRSNFRIGAALNVARGTQVNLDTSYDVTSKELTNVRAGLVYNIQCCGFMVEFNRFNFRGFREENTIRFGITLANIGSFGTSLGGSGRVY